MDSKALVRVRAAEGGKLWIPGVGDTNSDRRQIIKRLNAYDDRLILARHEVTGDWCVFLTERANPFQTGEPYPVLGLGRELPSADDVMHKLQKYDAVRNGEQILREINRQNERILKMVDDAAADASGVVAEGAESFLHDIGKTPYRRIMRPLKQTGVKMH